MLPRLRALLRAVARKLRPAATQSKPMEPARIDLLLRAVAMNVRTRGTDGGVPPSFAMLEVLVREVPSSEIEAALSRLDAEDAERILSLLALIEKSRQGFAEDEPSEHEAEPATVAVTPAGERAPPGRSLASLPDHLAETVRRSRLESIMLSGDARLERGVLDRLAGGEYDSATSAWVLRTVIDGSLDEVNRQRALSLVKADPFSKARAIRVLAEIAAWGIERGQELTGKIFRFRLYGAAEGEVGMTFLSGRIIHFNPLPLLRGEPDGRRIVEAIILHEIGHHRYNRGEEWEPVQEAAAEENLGSLLNLVQDEHLERNLRAINGEWGDALKVLASWAFQRASREVSVEVLLALLGAASFRVLVRAALEPARDRTRVRINSGRLLRELELHGSSFSRFLRALRMGLGNRTGDPKVAEALALFGSDFRDATPSAMLDIARELRRIFGGETGIGDTLGLHGATEADAGELAERLPGISDRDLADEIDALRRGPREPSMRQTRERTPVINRGAGTDFAEIDEVITLPFHAEEYRQLAKDVAGWSRRLRRFFETLGLSRITLRRRTAGSAVDRGALRRAVIGGDPRILMARRMVYRSDLFLGVVIDCSGSMARAGSMERAQLFAALIAEAARGLDGIEARFFGFTDEVIYDAGTASHCAVAQLEPHSGNNDAAALWYVARVAMASRRSARLLVMISDGAPTECSVEALRGLVKRLTASRIACAQVAVQEIEDVCFPDYVLVDDEDLSEAVGRFGRIVVRLVRRVVGR